MKLLEEWKWQASKEAFLECLNGNDTKENRDLISTQYHLFMYYVNVNRREDILKKIKNTSMLIKIRDEFPIEKKNKNLTKGAKSLCGLIK